MNPEPNQPLSRDLEGDIADYLKRVEAALRQAGQSTASCASVRKDLEQQIRAQLARIEHPTRDQLNRVLTAMDPPEAFNEPVAATWVDAAPTRRVPKLALGALLLALAAGVWLAVRRLPAQQPAAPAMAESAPEATVAAMPAPAPAPVILPEEAKAAPESSVPVAVAEFANSGNIGDADAIRMVISDGLINAMALTDGLRVVERAKLKDALAELKLGAEGLASQATALQIGKLTGARVILTGNIVRLGELLILTARLINAETGELSAVRATGDRGELLALVDDLGRQVIQRIAQQEKGVFARADDGEGSRLREKQKVVKAALAGRVLPRVLVMVPESHLQRRIPDPAGETELVLWLTDAGFQVASPEYEGLHAPTPVQAWTGETEIQFRGLQGNGGIGDLINISQRTLNQLLQPGFAEKREALFKVADVMVLGEGISERGSVREGLISCKARVELKAIDIQSGRVLLTKSEYGAGVDVAEHIAGKRALQAAARAMAPDLMVELVNAWQAVGSGTNAP